MIFFELMGGAQYDIFGIAVLLVRLALGGVLFGLLFGVIGLRWLSKAARGARREPCVLWFDRGTTGGSRPRGTPRIRPGQCPQEGLLPFL